MEGGKKGQILWFECNIPYMKLFPLSSHWHEFITYYLGLILHTLIKTEHDKTIENIQSLPSINIQRILQAAQD